MRKNTPLNKKAKQLFIYLKHEYDYHWAFIADVVNREFNTNLTKVQMRGAYSKHINLNLPIETGLIPEFLPDYPPEPIVS